MRGAISAVAAMAAVAVAACTGCGHPGRGGEVDGGGGVDAGDGLVDPVVASVWLSTDDGERKLQQQPDVEVTARSTSDPNVTVLTVDSEARFQEIDGFGSSLTESSAYLIAERMTAAQRRVLLLRLFDPAAGIGLTLLRQPMGASDFALGNYSYDDTAPDLSDFSIAHDQVSVVPVLKEIAALQPRLVLFATPWSPPGWMKTSGSMVGGTLVPERQGLLAAYFVKFLEAYAAEGLTFAYVTPQNEPHFSPGGYPGMRMEWPEQAAFIGGHLGPAIEAAGLPTQILVWDHNWNDAYYAANVLADEVARPFVAGSAFHCYGGDASAQTPVHDAHPELGIWMTECSSGEWNGGYAEGLHFDAQLVIQSMRNWARGVIKWNLALDEAHGPQNGGCGTCFGTVQVRAADGAVAVEAEYVALGHVARFVKEGARRVGSSGGGNATHVAFENPDGSIVVLVDAPEAVTLELRTRLGNVAYAVPAGAIATFVVGAWRPSIDRSSAVASASGGGGAAAAIDGDARTAWTSPQAGAEWLEVDLGVRKHLSAVTLDAADAESGGPRAFVVETSDDRSTWTERGSGQDADALVVVRFPRVAARHVRVRQVGTSPEAWTVAELNLHDE